MIEFNDEDIRDTAVAVLCMNEHFVGKTVENVIGFIKDVARSSFNGDGSDSYVATGGFMVTYYKAPGTTTYGVRTSVASWLVNRYVSHIQGALGTAETGIDLIEVARGAHRVEMEEASKTWSEDQDII